MRSKKSTSNKYPNFFVIGLLVIAALIVTVEAEEKSQITSEPAKQGELSKPATSLESEPKVAAESQLSPREGSSAPSAPAESQPTSQSPESKATAVAPAESDSASASELAGAEAKRKGRADAASSSSESNKSSEKGTTSTPAEKPAGEKAKTDPSKSSQKAKPQQTPKPATKSKLPANLGTVTSTGSGGPAHYLSKHDAYSAIAEKHGALSHESTRKTDHYQKRGSSSHLQPFGIQKAGGISDLLSNPFRGVTDNGLARTLGASMRSIMKGKYSVPAYVASALLGAVALMAFYESPISPLPVPPLPEPPVGRFPPEMPVISPNTQVPYRGNNQAYSQQGYNQRSSSMLPNYSQSQQQSSQVLFPANAQQRSGQVNIAVPVQQLAANLLSAGKQQVAQRKSSPDYDQQSLSRSFFGPSVAAPSPKMGSSNGPQKQGSSILGFFGLGGGSASSSASSASPANPLANGEQQAGAPSQPANTPLDLKNQPGQQNGAPGLSSSGPGLSNSHLVNKFKSYFSRAGGSAAQSGSSSAAASSANPYDQYQRMSLIQALMKDTAFLPAFLSPSRKSSSIAPGSAASASGATATKPASRMQIDSSASLPVASKQLANQRTSSGYGLVRTADRIAHALLETFTSSIAQRSAAQSSDLSDGASTRKSASDDSQANLLASATSSLLSDIMSSYNAASSEQLEQAKLSGTGSSPQTSSLSLSEQTAPNARSASDSSSAHDLASTQDQKASTGEQQQQVALTRKTRSIGFEYPIESNQELSLREQQPSKAAQINNVIDFVADSYTHNRLLFNFVMNQVGLSQAVPYVEQILASGGSDHRHH